MRNAYYRTWNMERKGKITEKEKYTLIHMAKKTEKGGKFRNVHCGTWNMAKN